VKDANANLPKAPEPYTRGSGGGAFPSAKDDHQSRVLWKPFGNGMNVTPGRFQKNTTNNINNWLFWTLST